MIEAEGQIEGRVSEPRALGIDEDRTARAKEDVLRADIAMHDGELRSRGPLRERFEHGRQVRMRARRREQIRFEAERMKRRARVELGGRCRRFRKRGVNGREPPANRGREFRNDTAPREL